ncbi:hypothetical protein [Sphingopyxis flava]|uniref:Uncharacterized protein n=1 Tax=Sphingopyxis flava TaxID=1507287 RepID=A0A1T5B4V6_9SPHN|nr:hypothetical protein [Sphingopyxis flava]SKB42205.1 hypothetical protein SAMN06295937_1005141 [Sphingopyxis flava]
MNIFLAQQSLFGLLIRKAASRASAMLADPVDAPRLRTPSDCGMTEIERLEHSVLAEDQLLAVALRLIAGPAAPSAIEAALDNFFATPPGRLAVEAQRRAVFQNGKGQPLALGPACKIAEAIEERLEREADRSLETLEAYADLYSDLWCDPRIAAPVTVRREMLALVNALHERCARTRAAERQEMDP